MTLPSILEAREERWLKKCALIRKKEGASVVSLTLRMPNGIRQNEDAKKVFLLAKDELHAMLDKTFRGAELECVCDSSDGPYAVWSVWDDAEKVKRVCMAFEEKSPLGELTDADVMKSFAEEISRTLVGGEERKCLVCGEENARVCLFVKKHTAQKTEQAIQNRIRQILSERM